MHNNDRSPRPSWLFWLGLLVFGYALLSKWNKWPAGTGLLIASGVLTLFGALMFPWRRGEGRVTGAVDVGAALMVVHTVFRLLYWPGAFFVGCAALVSAVVAAVLWWRSERSPAGMPVALCIVLACTAGLMAVPVHALYHCMFFESPGAQRFMHSGVGHWYRYSWFLYEDGQYEKSAVMIDSAMAEVANNNARTGKDGEWLVIQLRSVHAGIEARQWKEFRQLHSPHEPTR